MESFVPRSVIAGRIDGVRGRARQRAAEAAAALLGTRQVALVCSQQAEAVWYIAAPARDLSSHLGATCPLSAALPQSSGHQGDAAYTALIEGGLQAVLVKRGSELKSFVGTAEMVQRFIAMEACSSTHACETAGESWTFPDGDGSSPSGRIDRLAGWFSLAGLVVALLACGVWWSATSQSALQQQESEDLQLVHQAAARAALKALDPPAYPQALLYLQKAVEESAQEGGRLLQFEYREGRASWSLEVAGQTLNRGAP